MRRRSSALPDRPTKGWPSASSFAPGASPITISLAFGLPRAITTRWRVSDKPQAWQSAQERRSRFVISWTPHSAMAPPATRHCPLGPGARFPPQTLPSVGVHRSQPQPTAAWEAVPVRPVVEFGLQVGADTALSVVPSSERPGFLKVGRSQGSSPRPREAPSDASRNRIEP